MGSIRAVKGKRGTSYEAFVVVYEGGRRKRRSRTFKKKSLANAWLVETEAQSIRDRREGNDKYEIGRAHV